MLQVHTFQLPDEAEKANEFLATHKPIGDINFQHDQMIVFTEDGTVPPAYEIATLNELLMSVRAAKLQQEIALNTMRDEKKAPYISKNDEQKLTHQIIEVEEGIKRQNSKEAYILKRIEEVRSQGK